PGCVIGVVVERLMVELEDLVRAIGVRRVCGGVRVGARRPVAVCPSGLPDFASGVGPSTGVVGPADAGGAELVTDRRPSLGRQLWTSLEGLERRLDGVDRVVTAGASRNDRWAELRE